MSYINHTKDLYHKIPHTDVPRLSSPTDRPFSFVPMSNVILRCDTAYLKDSDETVSITPDFKLIYTYMRERYAFSKAKGQSYYESWDSIASIIGKSGNVFKSKNDRGLPINKLMEKIGLLVILDKKTCRANHKQVMDVYDVLDKVSFLNSKDADYKERKIREREVFIAQKLKEEEEEKAKVTTPPVEKAYHKPPEPLQTHNYNNYDDLTDEEMDGVPF